MHDRRRWKRWSMPSTVTTIIMVFIVQIQDLAGLEEYPERQPVSSLGLSSTVRHVFFKF